MTSKIKVNILADGADNSIITSDGAGSFTASSSLASSVQSVGEIQMTPAFEAYLSSDQSITSGAFVKEWEEDKKAGYALYKKLYKDAEDSAMIVEEQKMLKKLGRI